MWTGSYKDTTPDLWDLIASRCDNKGRSKQPQILPICTLTQSNPSLQRRRLADSALHLVTHLRSYADGPNQTENIDLVAFSKYSNPVAS